MSTGPGVKPAAIDAGALIDSGPWAGYQKLLTALAALAIVIDGFDIQILALAVPSLMKEWQEPRSAFAPALALGLGGMAVGGPIFGYLGDRIGRRPALIGAVVVFGLATVATAFIDSLAALSALRFFTGVGGGGAVPNATALAAEFAPVHRRHAAVKLTIVCIPLGGMLGGLVAAQVLPSFGWRALYWIGGLLPLVFALVLWTILPESPRFLAARSSGWPALGRFLNRLGHNVASGSTFEDGRERLAAKARLRDLWSSDHLRQTAGLWIAFAACMSAIYLVFGWLPTLLSSQGSSVASASAAIAVYNFGGVLGVLIWVVLTTLFGSRGPLISGAIAAAAGAVAIWLAPRALLMPALALNGLLANAVATSLYALAAHVYPTAIRSSGVAWGASLGRLGGIASSLAGATIIGWGEAAYWFAFAAAMLVACGGLALINRHIPVSSYGSSRG